MSTKAHYLAFDLGAESGRAVVGGFDGETLSLDTIHRFANGPVSVLDSLYWDVLRLYREMNDGLSAYSEGYGMALEGIGMDTWGVDFALLDRNDELLCNPHHYRDPRTEGILNAAFEIVPRDEIFGATGIQFMEINSLYQLLSMKRAHSPVLEQAESLLMMPDLFNYWFTGVKACEFSDATTSQCYDPRKRDWARPMLERLGLPTHIWQPVVQPGTVLGPLRDAVAEEHGLQRGIPFIAPATHDTGSAVAAVPAESKRFAYLSSGTWSLMGIEIADPIISEDSLGFNFTNEGGVCGTYRLLKNIMGLWLVQECRRTWAREGTDLSYDEITAMAQAAPAFGALVEPDAHDFLRPGDMPSRIRTFCERTGQAAPDDRGAIVRCALESLALKYRWCLEKLEIMSGESLDVIHIVGGGSQNRLLCQLTADATHRPVVAGPIEATAAGNCLMQAIASGRIASLDEARQVVRRSFEVITYEPRSSAGWEDAYGRFVAIQAAEGIEG